MDNKVISFKDKKQKFKEKRYELKAQISVYISRCNDTYYIGCSSLDDISMQDIYKILNRIFREITKEVQLIKYKKEDTYEVSFTLLYFEKGASQHVKYICNPPSITKEKLAEYLWLFLNIYELKEKGIL